jgi:hypothetical protein
MDLAGALQAPLSFPALAHNSPVPADGPYPGPHATYYYGPRYLTYPISTAGQLFFSTSGGNFRCTAHVTVGDAGVLNRVWTAGHCVSNGAGVFHFNWLFCPSYNSSGVNPARGCWRGTSATTPTAWHATGNIKYDYASVGLENCVAGTASCLVSGQVATYTGGLGFAWNLPRDQHWHHYGYPGSPWDGMSIVYTTTEHRYDDDPGGPGPLTNSWGSSQSPGSSGSALVVQFSYSGGYINSNVSYSYSSESGFEIYGPYFDTAACGFWKAVTGWTGTC